MHKRLICCTLRETTKPFILFFTIIILFMIYNVFSLLGDRISKMYVPSSELINMVLYRIPGIMTLALSTAWFLAVLLGAGRIASCSEVMEMRSRGVSLFQLLTPIFSIGILLSVLAFLISDSIAPLYTPKSEAIIRRIVWEGQTPESYSDTASKVIKMSCRQLAGKIEELSRRGENVRELQMALHIRMSFPFFCLFLSFIAAPVSIRFYNGMGRWILLLSIPIMMVVYRLLSVLWALGKIGRIEPVIAAWSLNAAMFILGCFLIWRLDKR